MTSLLALLDEHQEAVEYELIALGLRLHWLGADLTWRDLLVVVRQSPPGNAIARSIDPQGAAWGVAEHLQRHTIDLLAAANWMASEDGSKGRNRPKPYPGPGVVDPDEAVYGSGAVPLDELDEFLGWKPPKLTIVA